MSNKARVDILLATYNGEKYLEELLKSIENQTYANWRLIVSDDGSTDKTIEILKRFKNKYLTRVTLLLNNKSGSAKKNFMNLMNLDIEYSNYIAFCDQDDVWLENKIEALVNEMISLESLQADKPTLVYSDLYVVNERLQIISNSFFSYTKVSKHISLPNLLIQNSVPGCSMMINSALLKFAKKNINIENILMHDWWLVLIAKCFGELKLIEDPLILYRQHNSNSVGAQKFGLKKIFHKIVCNDLKKIIFSTMIQAKEFLDIYGENLGVEEYKIINIYANLYEKHKLYRIYSYFKYNYFKYNVLRKVGQILCG